MMNIKMSDVFGSLAITSKSAGEYKLESTNGELYAAFTARKFCTYAAEAIDKYDINESRVAELIKCGNEFEFVINEQRKRIDQLELFAKQSQGVIEHINVIASSDQKRIAELEAEAESAQKKAYWRGFETGSVNSGGNILQHYNAWLDFKEENDAR